jgi:hypothetical protein
MSSCKRTNICDEVSSRTKAKYIGKQREQRNRNKPHKNERRTASINATNTIPAAATWASRCRHEAAASPAGMPIHRHGLNDWLSSHRGRTATSNPTDELTPPESLDRITRVVVLMIFGSSIHRRHPRERHRWLLRLERVSRSVRRL